MSVFRFIHRHLERGAGRAHTIGAKVERIYIAPRAGEAMKAVNAAEALAGRGLQGDRYGEDRGHWKITDACQVTCIAGEDLDAIARGTSIRVLDGEHRRNIVTRGIRLRALTGRLFRIGDAVFEYEHTRPPCGYVERLTEPGMVRALSKRGGICVRVVESGALRVGDPIDVL